MFCFPDNDLQALTALATKKKTNKKTASVFIENSANKCTQLILQHFRINSFQGFLKRGSFLFF